MPLSPYFVLAWLATMQEKNDVGSHYDFKGVIVRIAGTFSVTKLRAAALCKAIQVAPKFFFNFLFCAQKMASPKGKKIFGQALLPVTFLPHFIKFHKKVTQR